MDKYYMGYKQCFLDFLNILEEFGDTSERKVFIDLDQMRGIYQILCKRIDETKDWGYMFYDMTKKMFVYLDEEE